MLNSLFQFRENLQEAKNHQIIEDEWVNEKIYYKSNITQEQFDEILVLFKNQL